MNFTNLWVHLMCSITVLTMIHLIVGAQPFVFNVLTSMATSLVLSGPLPITKE